MPCSRGLGQKAGRLEGTSAGLWASSRRGDAALRNTCAVMGLLVVGLVAVEPTTRRRWPPLRPALVGAVEVVALPLRLARLAAQPPDAVLLMPVAGATVTRITDTWGAPRPGGRTHQGQDIFARKGTAVRSATRGYVVRLGHNALGGRVVRIAGAGGRRYDYAHLEAFAPDPRVGRYVTPETHIGGVGTTGHAARTPPHLHCAVYTAVGAVDPLPMLQDRGPAASEGVRTRGLPILATGVDDRGWRGWYIDTGVGSPGKCGCRAQACTQSYWQIQRFKR